jgi:hypothetical protein
MPVIGKASKEEEAEEEEEEEEEEAVVVVVEEEYATGALYAAMPHENMFEPLYDFGGTSTIARNGVLNGADESSHLQLPDAGLLLMQMVGALSSDWYIPVNVCNAAA